MTKELEKAILEDVINRLIKRYKKLTNDTYVPKHSKESYERSN